MPDLSFEIVSCEVQPYAAIPTLAFKLQITNAIEDEEVYAAALKCQVLIEATKRKYNTETKENLKEVFGEPQRWEETVKSLLWTTITIPVARFKDKTIVDVLIGCSEDHLTAAGKYFYSVKDGVIPLAFLFSGTLFFKSKDGDVQVIQVPWHKEAAYKMPSKLWQDMIETYFPNGRWLQINKDVFDKLYRYKTMKSFTTMEGCISTLIDDALKETVQNVEGKDIIDSTNTLSDDDAALKEIIHTLLYEGYSLYPYRSTALKNKTPIPFGVIYPEEYCKYNEYVNCKMQTECIVKAGSMACLNVSIIFLQIDNINNLSEGWKAIEREIHMGTIAVKNLLNQTDLPIKFTDEIKSGSSLEGLVTVQAIEITEIPNVFRVSVSIENTTPVEQAASISNNEVIKSAFVSTHTILKIEHGEFISSQNPGAEYHAFVDECKNLNTYPILINEANTVMLSSPIALYDHFKIHLGSSGNLFDGTEMEEALLLHVNVLTDEEKKQVTNGDAKLNAMMDKINSVTPEEIINMHDKMINGEKNFK